VGCSAAIGLGVALAAGLANAVAIEPKTTDLMFRRSADDLMFRRAAANERERRSATALPLLLLVPVNF
jgi:hypothetical protein